MKLAKCMPALALALVLTACSSPAAQTGNVIETETEDVTENATESVTETIATQVTEFEEETQTESEAPEVKQITITAVGDCTLGATQTHGYEGSFHQYYDKNGEDYFFAGVRDIFEADDFTLINLECVLTTSNQRVEKTWNLKGKPEYVGIMTGSSVEACSLGNNHTRDYGEQSLKDTEDALDQAGILYGLDEHTAIYTTDSGVVIGIVSANLLSQDDRHAGYIRDGIASLREQGADLVLVSCHWGIEGDHYANAYQTKMAHQIIDWGADALIGSHPHVLQGVELYNGKVICYSLGNFCFGGNRNPQDKDTAVFQQTFTFVDGALQADVNAQIIPYRLSSTSARNDFQPTKATKEAWERIIQNMNAYSASFSDICFDSNGKIILNTDN